MKHVLPRFSRPTSEEYPFLLFAAHTLDDDDDEDDDDDDDDDDDEVMGLATTSPLLL